MEENSPPPTLEGKITGISFSLATRQEICLASISDCPISHASQLSNPFLGLPLEVGKCEACGTAETGKCEGHFGYIELPIPIYHPSHISELKRILSSICLKCLKFKSKRLQAKNVGVLERAFSVCCDETAEVTVCENQKKDGACFLELKLPRKRIGINERAWGFLDKYGYRYGGGATTRPLLPTEVLKILKKIPEATKKKLAAKGCFFQEGYIMQHLPVPPNCLSTPDVSDGITVTSSDISMPMLKKVLRQVEIIKSSRSGTPNFESLEVEVNDLQLAVSQYLLSRGAKASPDRNTRYAIARTASDSSSTKAWLEKMKTLFISKGSGFSSRSVITGDPYKGVDEIGIPFEIAQRITFEERVTEHNMKFLQKLVDEKLCLTYIDGQNTYSLREGSKGHTFLKPGQIVHRKIMDGDVIFINRPPTTHKHSLQALSVYIHEDHTFKINPLICGPLSADFDGDCIHIFYPQSTEAKAEVLELFAVDKQLLSSHSGNVNLQLGSDSLLSLKTLFKKYFFTKAQVQQLALFTSNPLPKPSMLKVRDSGPLWTVLELLETSLPSGFDCLSDKFVTRDSKILKLDYSRDTMQSIINEIISSIFFTKGPKEVLKLFNSLQPMLMENLCDEGFDLSLEDFIIPKDVLKSTEEQLEELSSLLFHLRSNYNEVIDLQLEKHLRACKAPISDFITRYSSMGNLIDPKSDSALTRIVQQVGFLGLQIYERGRLYSRTLTEDLSSHFVGNYPFPEKYPFEEFGLIRSGLFNGLDPYQELVHSIASREVMIRSSRGLTEPGILFKNSMAILRDVVICYDGTVRNVCSNSIIQFEYGTLTKDLFAAGEPVGVLAATAMSNPAYKAVLDSSPSSNNSWNMMKEILQCGVNFKNAHNDRRVVLYLNDCDCGEKHCLENAALKVKNHLRKVSLKDVAKEFLIEHTKKQATLDNAETEVGLVGHIHLNKVLLEESNLSMETILKKCEDTVNSFRKMKKAGQLFQKIAIFCSECSFQQSSTWTPCLKFFLEESPGIPLEKTTRAFANQVCPVLLNSVIKGDPRVKEANITWINSETTVWIKNPSKDQKGDLAVDVVLEKESVKKSGDAWRTVMDACLPVIHLIDTTRSIPYAIKEVENLLGIACAFEQAVQRLSTSVSMVTKGMLKEHLLLLASSMTCAGFLVGFNISGIKALNKTLNFQVPFSEATVYTPKRCFEKAAEKCHSDSLTSIVGSCSWGKPVAVGTGSRFDILWDTREMKLDQTDGIDVYNFLHLVGGGSEEADSGCLAGEVDSFDMDDNFMEAGSPEIDSGLAKPSFEDGLDLSFGGMDVDQSGWGTGPAPENGTSSGGWGAAVKTTPADNGGWGAAKADLGQPSESSGGWGAAQTTTTPAAGSSWGAAKADLGQPSESSGGWGAAQTTTPAAGSSWGAGKADQGQQSESSGGWGAAKTTTPAAGSSWGAAKADLGQPSESSGGWGAAKTTTPTTGGSWGAAKADQGQQNESSSGWGAVKTTTPAAGGSWGATKDKQGQPNESSGGWGAAKTAAPETAGGWGAAKDKQGQPNESSGGWGAAKTAAPETGGAWGAAKDKQSHPNESSGGWGAAKTAAPETGGGWGAPKSDQSQQIGSSGGWGATKTTPEISGGWGVPKSDQSRQTGSSGGWGPTKAQKDVEPSGRGAKSETEPEKDSGAWGSKTSQDETATGAGSSAWGQKVVKADDGPGWGKKKNEVENEKDSSAWGQKVVTSDAPAWGEKKIQNEPEESGSGWGQKKDPVSAEKGQEDGEQKHGSWGWNRKAEQKPDQGGGWKKKENWGPKRDRPARPVGGPNDAPRPNVPLTVTRQRIDLFTSDEQEILSVIEPIMQSIRRIMNPVGSNDGEPLSADDQKYILDNIFAHHPDKAQKAGAGVDYIMVTKHTQFQDSRCFFVVSTDGKKEDFSYRKCLENFVRSKFPDKVDEFIPKYFRKNQPRPPMNRDEAGTPRTPRTPGSRPGWGRDSNVAGDDSATPASGWKKDASTAPEEGGTPAAITGWKKEANTGPEEGGVAASGWKKEASPAPESGGASGSGWDQAGDGGNANKSDWGS
ncbi:DNA-directed RNA polymerase V subunit 1-like [Bidens hawaiensis]|uniref:DNA-directed RNA polymerase V subunit 1-like n=1 Tax=Bidens hawaiensis TaxID=980011 RepID=UPI00404A09CB